ncbi:hypothetical protein Taro_047005 [Colocasia esculenta]|uniref:RNase H type-1 domain-containing protein n=1 Tax=Colocasia esculenta TaxID=4460 RepID=A0A843X069_COLES|nr:hypothetical protein [Colocasia esculenta]
MNALPIPATFVKAFHRLLANFFWGSYEGSPKRHWKNWNVIAQPKESGGLGVINLHHMQIAFKIKMQWRALSTNSLWAKFFRGKHLFNRHYSEAHFPFMLAADRKLWQQAAQIIHANHMIISMDSRSEAYFWFDVWTGKKPLKHFIPKDIWTDMPNKNSTIQQAFSDPMSIQLQTALRHCPRHLLSHFLTTNEAKDTWIWCSTTDIGTEQDFNVKKCRPNTFAIEKILPTWLTVLHHKTSGKENLKANIPSVVRWLTPPQGRLKLNVDGAFKGTSGEAGGGGILRDHEGNMCSAFAKAYYGLNSSLAAEALALRDDISIYCRTGASEVLVETDSLQLTQIVTRQLVCPWDLACILQDIVVMTQEFKAEISYAPPKTNKVADCLASFALSCTHLVTWASWADLPTNVKELLLGIG